MKERVRRHPRILVLRLSKAAGSIDGLHRRCLLARTGPRGEAGRGDVAGATVKEPPHDAWDSRPVAPVTDPDGNVIGCLRTGQ